MRPNTFNIGKVMGMALFLLFINTDIEFGWRCMGVENGCLLLLCQSIIISFSFFVLLTHCYFGFSETSLILTNTVLGLCLRFA